MRHGDPEGVAQREGATILPGPDGAVRIELEPGVYTLVDPEDAERLGGKVPMLFDHSGDHEYLPRRMTPRETARMQGFPDSFGWPEHVSDTQRYKMVGNSVTVPLVRRVIEHAVHNIPVLRLMA